MDTIDYRKLHLGCGKTYIKGWVNVDRPFMVDADETTDFEQPDWGTKSFEENSVDTVYMAHTLEHLHDPLAFFTGLYRVCKPGAICCFKVPYGSSDIADEDPTHFRRYFLNSFAYFGQTVYGGADYGYRGDFKIVERVIVLNPAFVHLIPETENEREKLAMTLEMVHVMRNLALELVITMECVKPARERGTGQESSPLNFALGQYDPFTVKEGGYTPHLCAHLAGQVVVS